jgi:hypothetical protein
MEKNHGGEQKQLHNTCFFESAATLRAPASVPMLLSVTIAEMPSLSI